MSQSPATADEVLAVFNNEFSPDQLGPVRALLIARSVAYARARAGRTPEHAAAAWLPHDIEMPDITDALAELVADGKLVCALGQSVRRTWPGVYKPTPSRYERDEAYYARPATVERWARSAKYVEEEKAELKAAVSRLQAALESAGPAAKRAQVSTRSREITIRAYPFEADRLAELLELAVEQERRQGRRGR